MKNRKITAREEFALQLYKYRNSVDISQQKLATGLEMQQSYIARLEGAKASVGIDILEDISFYFGVKYYKMADPEVELPPPEELFGNIIHYHNLMGIDTGYLKNKSPKYTKSMDNYIKEHLLEPKTSTEIAVHFKEVYKVDISASKVSDILGRSPRKELLLITKPAGKNIYQLKPPDHKNSKSR